MAKKEAKIETPEASKVEAPAPNLTEERKKLGFKPTARAMGKWWRDNPKSHAGDQNLQTLGYILETLARNYIDPTNINILQLFGSKESPYDLIDDRTKINEIVAAAPKGRAKAPEPVVKPSEKDIKKMHEVVAERSLAHLKGQLSQALNNAKQLDRNADDAVRNALSYRRDSVKAWETAQALEDRLAKADKDAGVSKIIEDCLALEGYHNWAVNGNDIIAITAHPVILNHQHGFEYDVAQLGYFAVSVNPQSFHVSVYPYKANIKASGYFHPHIAADGLPCLGEAAGAISKAQKDNNLARVFEIMLGQLNTYNPRSPYVALRNFWERPAPYTDYGRWSYPQLTERLKAGR